MSNPGIEAELRATIAELRAEVQSLTDRVEYAEATAQGYQDKAKEQGDGRDYFKSLYDKAEASLAEKEKERDAAKKHLKACVGELRGLMNHATRGDGLDWRYTRNALCDAEDYLNGK